MEFTYKLRTVKFETQTQVTTSVNRILAIVRESLKAQRTLSEIHARQNPGEMTDFILN